jgi:hypothetical protein
MPRGGSASRVVNRLDLNPTYYGPGFIRDFNGVSGNAAALIAAPDFTSVCFAIGSLVFPDPVDGSSMVTDRNNLVRVVLSASPTRQLAREKNEY